ncbi:hypothetical protein MMC22_001765 [Lobaria immixta]|nr:hypothetical protein [Lobaria immixta]
MSMSLAALPTELLSCIVVGIESKHTLCNLARCSRRLYLCTIPHLYHSVTIREETRHGKQQYELLKNLACLLIRRPDLAELVRHFTLHITRPPIATAIATAIAREEYSKEFERSKEFKDWFLIAPIHISSLTKEGKINCLEKFPYTYKSQYDLILAFLLPAFLKVESLVLHLKTVHDTYYLEEMMQRAGCRERPFDIQPPLEALTVFVHSQDSFNVRSRSFIASLLKLPAIQKITGCFGNTWNDNTDKNLVELESSSSPLISLDLKAYELSKTDLCHILRAPKALKTFFYRLCRCDDIRFTDLRHALGPQETYLDSLGFDCEDTWSGGANIHGPMPSFISFNALRVFKIKSVCLASTDKGTKRDNLINIFPPNLETLHLTCFEAQSEHLVEALEHLLSQKSPQQIPSLTKLILEETYYFDASLGERSRANAFNWIEALWRKEHYIVIKRLRRLAAPRGVSIDVTEIEVRSP